MSQIRALESDMSFNNQSVAAFAEQAKRRSRVSMANAITNRMTALQGFRDNIDLMEEMLETVDSVKGIPRYKFFVRYWIWSHEYQRHESSVLTKHQDMSAIPAMWHVHFNEGVCWNLTYNELIWYPLLEHIVGKEVVDVCRDELRDVFAMGKQVDKALPLIRSGALGTPQTHRLMKDWHKILNDFSMMEEMTLMPVISCMEPAQLQMIEQTLDKRWYILHAMPRFFTSLALCRDACRRSSEEVRKTWSDTSIRFRVKVAVQSRFDRHYAERVKYFGRATVMTTVTDNHDTHGGEDHFDIASRISRRIDQNLMGQGVLPTMFVE